MSETTPLDQPTVAPTHPTRSLWFWFSASLFALGFAWRLLPLFDRDGRLLYQWPSEDGYLTLQIARNMSLGLGMSVSEGTLPTNGTQPFWTFVWSLLYRLADSDKETGVLFVLIAELVLSLGSAVLLHGLARHYFRSRPDGAMLALLASALWFGSPVGIAHTMNCLETGGYAFAVLASLSLYGRLGKDPGKWSWVAAGSFGVVLGWVFWVRNDSVFFILGLCVAHWVVGVRQHGLALFGRSLAETLVFGSVSVAVATPWLYYNTTTFGHLMPISGIAESHAASFAHNLHLLPTVLLEYIGVVLPIPQRFERFAAVSWIAAALVCAALLGMARHFLRTDRHLDVRILAVVIFGSCLSLFYGLYFGAGHFMNRYFFPLSPFFALVGAGATFAAMSRLRERGLGFAPALAAALVGIVIMGLHYRTYQNGTAHPHRQVIEYVRAHVPTDAWVGAVQTGTLGYFHDRTYNLDGKVNPEALEAKLEGAIPQYVVDKNIRYLVDWVGIASFANLSPIDEHFRLVMKDHEKNLAVLERVD